jgi:hypothetical protein
MTVLIPFDAFMSAGITPGVAVERQPARSDRGRDGLALDGVDGCVLLRCGDRCLARHPFRQDVVGEDFLQKRLVGRDGGERRGRCPLELPEGGVGWCEDCAGAFAVQRLDEPACWTSATSVERRLSPAATPTTVLDSVEPLVPAGAEDTSVATPTSKISTSEACFHLEPPGVDLLTPVVRLPCRRRINQIRDRRVAFVRINGKMTSDTHLR